MLALEPVHAGSPRLGRIEALYRSAFPANERRPLEVLLKDESGAGEVFAAMDGETFVDFCVLLTHMDLTHILYFAVEPGLRRRGYGARILAAIRERYPAHRVLADLEAPVPDAPNRDQREKRIAFYARNGYALTEIRYRWEKEDYLVMSAGGNVTGPEFSAFWRHFYSLDAGYDY